MPTNEPVIRPATLADAETIAAIHGEGRRWAYRGLMPDALLDAPEVGPELRAMWERVLAAPRPKSAVLLIERESMALGHAAVGPSRDPDAEGAGEIYSIYLRDRAVAGTGLGRALMQAALGALRDEGFAVVTLWVLDTNERARRFYERAGFVADGATKLEELRGVPLPHVRYRCARNVPSEPA